MTHDAIIEGPSTSPEWAAALIALLERQHALVTELAELAQRQADLIETRRTDALLGLLARRQRLIDAFTGSQEELAGLTGDVEARIAGLAEPSRSRIQELIAEIGRHLAGVMQRDGKDQETLEHARRETAKELSSIDATRNARSAYGGGSGTTSSPGARFADRTG